GGGGGQGGRRAAARCRAARGRGARARPRGGLRVRGVPHHGGALGPADRRAGHRGPPRSRCTGVPMRRTLTGEQLRFVWREAGGDLLRRPLQVLGVARTRSEARLRGEALRSWWAAEYDGGLLDA